MHTTRNRTIKSAEASSRPDASTRIPLPLHIAATTICSRIRSLRVAALSLGFFLVLAATLHAQLGGSGSINGAVTDPSGAVVVGATVTATNTGTSIVQIQTTNGQGYYSFQSLPLGSYLLTVQ